MGSVPGGDKARDVMPCHPCAAGPFNLDVCRSLLARVVEGSMAWQWNDDDGTWARTL